MASRMGDFEALLGRADISVVIMEIVILNGWDLDLLIDNNPVKVNFSNRRILRPILLHRLNLACELKNLNWGTRFITSDRYNSGNRSDPWPPRKLFWIFPHIPLYAGFLLQSYFRCVCIPTPQNRIPMQVTIQPIIPL